MAPAAGGAVSSTTESTPEHNLPASRAIDIRVGCYAGHRYPERPQWVEAEGTRVEVASLESEWREEERLGYRVSLRDGRRMLLYYVSNEDRWSGVVLA